MDGVNITNTGYGAVGSYSIVFGSLGNGVTNDFIKETQVKTGGLRGRVRPGHGRRGERRHQERHQRLPRQPVRLLPARRRSRPTGEQFQTVNGTVNTVGTRRVTWLHPGRPARQEIDMFFFGAFNPQ